MKKFIALTILAFSVTLSFAAHITGGEMYYTYVQQLANGNHQYSVTLKLYRNCGGVGAPLDGSASIAVYSTAGGAPILTRNAPLARTQLLSLGAPDPCIQNPPAVCYEVGFYEFTIDLPPSAAGYIISYQRCCRAAGIINLNGSDEFGGTYMAEIPGTNSVADGPVNNSARFLGVDTVIVCARNAISYNFGAQDLNATDSLVYYFCSAYTGGGQAGGPAGGPNTPTPSPPTPPPYNTVSYSFPFSGDSPLGAQVTIDPKTGHISGIAPDEGVYVVTVCVDEYRNGVRIATQKKDLQIKVGDCNAVDADLRPEYVSCDDFNYTFFNEAPPNPLTQTYYWDFGDGGTSTDESPTHQYLDTGIYNIKLVINRGLDCEDSATSILRVYPGFFPGFIFSGVCMDKPTQFTDTTKTRYGTVNSWKWDFGDPGSLTDISTLQNPSYTYGEVGIKNVRLIVTSSKGCVDTAFQDVAIIDKPPLDLAFKDTLICRGDQVQLQATGSGNFSWTPLTNITNPNTATPTVNPTVTTTYTVTLDDNGCVNTDAVRVRVVNFVTLGVMNDTTICATDTVRLRAFGDGLRYAWQPTATLDDPDVSNPLALPTATTTYQVTATIGSCTATEDVTVTLVPYPVANAGPDATICFNTSTRLNGTITGAAFTWSPANSLDNPASLTPLASPKNTTNYVLSVTDVLGCPKPHRDTVLITVLPEVFAFAGNDTAVVVGQPLQLRGTGGTTYQWSPATALNNPRIADPIGKYDGSFESIKYYLTVQDAAGCTDIDSVTVRIFKTDPRIFVPTAFTPNGDGRNDRFTFIAAGISKIDFFRVYNRWGQLVYSSTANSTIGWDGKIGGKDQGSGTFVWMIQGSDYTGKQVFAKGTVTLIR